MAPKLAELMANHQTINVGVIVTHMRNADASRKHLTPNVLSTFAAVNLAFAV